MVLVHRLHQLPPGIKVRGFAEACMPPLQHLLYLCHGWAGTGSMGDPTELGMTLPGRPAALTVARTHRRQRQRRAGPPNNKRCCCCCRRRPAQQPTQPILSTASQTCSMGPTSANRKSRPLVCTVYAVCVPRFALRHALHASFWSTVLF